MRPSLPILKWGRAYNRERLLGDGVAAVIVTIMLIPQSLAYAMLAGLPPEVGLYASVAPLLLYAVFGTRRVLTVGPVALVSLMTAAAIGDHAVAGSPDCWAVAITFAFLSGVLLLAIGLLLLGFLANFLSHPVISGFISASGILIAASQLKTLPRLTDVVAKPAHRRCTTCHRPRWPPPSWWRCCRWWISASCARTGATPNRISLRCSPPCWRRWPSASRPAWSWG